MTKDKNNEPKNDPKLKPEISPPNGDQGRALSIDLPTARREVTLHKWHGVERKDGSDQEEREIRWDWSFAFTISGLLVAAIFAGIALLNGKIPATLTAIAFIPPFLFTSFERYVSRLELDRRNNDKYYPNLGIWRYGMILGMGLVVSYLFVRFVLSRINEFSADISPSSTALWHDGIILFFLSTSLVIVLYALVNVSRSEI